MTTLDKSRARIDPEQGHEPTPLIAIASIIVSMALIAVGNGLMFAYIPVRLGADGFDPVWAGLIVTGLSGGGIAGCLLTGPLVRRVGHAQDIAHALQFLMENTFMTGAVIECDGGLRLL